MEARQAAEAREQVTALYREHALGLVKLAVLMVGDQLTAEDVVQDAFLIRPLIESPGGIPHERVESDRACSCGSRLG